MTIDECCELLKKHIIEELRVENVVAEDLSNDSPLFGHEGLGLDSLDAVELVVVVGKKFGVKIASPDEAKAAFQSVQTLAEYIVERQA